MIFGYYPKLVATTQLVHSKEGKVKMSHSKTSIRFFIVNLGADFPRNAAFDMG